MLFSADLMKLGLERRPTDRHIQVHLRRHPSLVVADPQFGR